MREHTMTTRLVCSWQMVTDASGRAHMEAFWAPVQAAAVASPTAA